MKLPKAKNENLVVQNLKDEILIYDLITHKAYNLNETSSIIYQACGDGLTFKDLKRKHQFTDDLIYFALDELKTNNLLEDYQNNYFGGLSRREVIRKVGLASMIALPVISSLVAPSAIQAQSAVCTNGPFSQDRGTCPIGQRCVNGSCSPCIPNGDEIPGGCSNGARCCTQNCTPGDGRPDVCGGEG